MGRTACTEPQCLYKGALYFVYIKRPTAILLQTTVPHGQHSHGASNFREGIKHTELRQTWQRATFKAHDHTVL